MGAYVSGESIPTQQYMKKFRRLQTLVKQEKSWVAWKRVSIVELHALDIIGDIGYTEECGKCVAFDHGDKTAVQSTRGQLQARTFKKTGASWSLD